MAVPMAVVGGRGAVGMGTAGRTEWVLVVEDTAVPL